MRPNEISFSIRMPVDLLDKLTAIVEHESEEQGVRVTRTFAIHRMIIREYESILKGGKEEER